MFFDLQRFTTTGAIINAINNGEVITLSPGAEGGGGSDFSEDITNAIVEYFSPFDLKTQRIEAPFADEDDDNTFPSLVGVNIAALADGNNFVADTTNNRIMSGPSSYNTLGKSIGYYALPPQEKYYKLIMLVANYGYSSIFQCYVTDDITKAQNIGNSQSGLYQLFSLSGTNSSNYRQFSVTLAPDKTFYVCFYYKENGFKSGYDNRCYIGTTAIQLLAPWIIDGVHCEAFLDGQNFAVYQDSSTQNIFISTVVNSSYEQGNYYGINIGIVPLGKADYTRKVTITLSPYNGADGNTFIIQFRKGSPVSNNTKELCTTLHGDDITSDISLSISVEAGIDWYLDITFQNHENDVYQPRIKSIIIEPLTTTDSNVADVKNIVENHLPDLISSYRSHNHLDYNDHMSLVEYKNDLRRVNTNKLLYEATRNTLYWGSSYVNAVNDVTDVNYRLYMYGDKIQLYTKYEQSGSIYKHSLMSNLGTGQSLTSDTTAIAYNYETYRLSENSGFVIRFGYYNNDGRDAARYVIPFKINSTGKPTLGTATSITPAAPSGGTCNIEWAAASVMNPYSVMYFIVSTDTSYNDTYRYTVMEFDPVSNTGTRIVSAAQIGIKYDSTAGKASHVGWYTGNPFYVPVVKFYGNTIQITHNYSDYPGIEYMVETYDKNDDLTAMTDYLIVHHGLYRTAPLKFTVSTWNSSTNKMVPNSNFVSESYFTGINVSKNGGRHYVIAWNDGYYPYVDNWQDVYFKVYSVDYTVPALVYNSNYKLSDID